MFREKMGMIKTKQKTSEAEAKRVKKRRIHKELYTKKS